MIIPQTKAISMAPVSNGRVVCNSYADSLIEPGKTLVYEASSVIDLENAPLNGGFLLKTLVLCIDFYMLPRMLKDSYFGQVRLGPRLKLIRTTYLTNK
jgi:hypothetical protein